MNTLDIVKAISKKNKISQVLAKKLLHSHIENITQQLVSGNRVILKGFGSFAVKEQKARKAWIPSKKIYQNINAKNAIKFSPATQLKNEINEAVQND